MARRRGNEAGGECSAARLYLKGGLREGRRACDAALAVRSCLCQAGARKRGPSVSLGVQSAETHVSLDAPRSVFLQFPVGAMDPLGMRPL